jgi:hypothetical protein
MWDRNMCETCAALKAAQLLLSKVVREGSEAKSSFYQEAITLLAEGGVQKPVQTLREDVLKSLAQFVAGMEELKQIDQTFKDVPAWSGLP